MDDTYRYAEIQLPYSSKKVFEVGKGNVKEIRSWATSPEPYCSVAFIGITWGDDTQETFNLHHVAWWKLAY